MAKPKFKIKHTITKKEWNKTHKDFKSIIDGVHYVMKLTDKGTALVPVNIEESVNEASGWSKSALDAFRRKPMPGRYFISDENGNILEKGLKTNRSWVSYLDNSGKVGGSLSHHGIPKVVNIHDGKKNNEVVDQYYWVDKGGNGRYSIDIDNPTAGSHGKINPKFVNYKQIEKQLGIKNESVNENDGVYFKSYTAAIEAARAAALKKGFVVDDDEMFTKVGINSKRPSVGKTTKVSLELTKNGKPQRKMLHIQVYGMKNGYELNSYIN